MWVGQGPSASFLRMPPAAQQPWGGFLSIPVDPSESLGWIPDPAGFSACADD